MLEVVTGKDEYTPKKIQQLGMRRLGVIPVIDRLHKPPAHVAFPKTVRNDLGKSLVARIGQARRKLFPRVPGFTHHFVMQRSVHQLRKRPRRCNIAARLKRDIHQPPQRDVRRSRNRTACRYILRTTLKHRRQAKQLLLPKIVIRRVMAPRTFHFQSKKRLRYKLRLGRHRHIVLRRHFKPRRASIIFAALHHHQLGDKAIERLVVGE